MIEHSRKSEEYQTGLDYATDSWLHFIIDLIGNENDQLATVIGQDKRYSNHKSNVKMSLIILE